VRSRDPEGEETTVEITRRELLKWASVGAVSLGLGAENLVRLEKALAAVGAPPVIWLQGASCSGCSVSLLNATSPIIDTVLTDTVSMEYHPDLMAAYGETAITSMFNVATVSEGKFVLCVEGAAPVGASGRYCVVGQRDGAPLTLVDAVQQLGPKAKRVVAVGTCASFGGVPKPSAITQVRTVADVLTGRTSAPVVNLPGCPAHPNTVLATIVRIVTNQTLALDSVGRPTLYYGSTVHHNCPRRETEDARIGSYGCYEEVGCRGPETSMACPIHKWNNGRNWCVAANMACIGCAAPDFPTNPLLSGDGDD
jgi:hydrogenase small subunit